MTVAVIISSKMIRFAVGSVLRVSRSIPLVQNGCRKVNLQSISKQFSTLSISATAQPSLCNNLQCNPLRSSLVLQTLLPSNPVLTQQPVRTVTKFSLRKGKRKSVKAVIKRFKRLHWGAWIRTRCGRHKKMWKKSPACRKRLRQHVFVNGQQASLLDKMVTTFWRRPKYYLDDPYTPYHTRKEFRYTKGNRI